jgi:hypothetical protein
MYSRTSPPPHEATASGLTTPIANTRGAGNHEDLARSASSIRAPVQHALTQECCNTFPLPRKRYGSPETLCGATTTRCSTRAPTRTNADAMATPKSERRGEKRPAADEFYDQGAKIMIPVPDVIGSVCSMTLCVPIGVCPTHCAVVCVGTAWCQRGIARSKCRASQWH